MVDWSGWQAHVDAVVRDRGVWVGLLDEDWVPIADLEPLEMSESSTRLAAPEVSLTLAGEVEGRVSLAVDELVAEDLGVFDERGYFRAKNDVGRSIGVAREGSRQAFFIPYLDASGESSPEKLVVEAAGLLSLLEAWPCPSIPESWRGEWSLEAGDAGAEYVTARELSLFEMATRADGYTVHGPAVLVIRRVIQDSLDAVNRQMGWDDPHLVVDWSGDVVSPEAMIRPDDGLVLSTVEETARLAGVNISVGLWWPGDGQVVVRDPDDRASDAPVTKSVEFSHPVGVVRVEKIKEA